MSTQSVEAIYEADTDDRPESERQRAAHHAAVQDLDHEDILRVALDYIREQAPDAIMALIQEQQEDPYPSYGAYMTPDKAQAVALAWVDAIREAQDKLSGQALAGRVPR